MTDRWVLQSQGVSYLVGGHHEQVVSLVSVQRPPLGHVEVGFTALREEGMCQGPAYRKDSQSQVTWSATHTELTWQLFNNNNTHTYWYFGWPQSPENAFKTVKGNLQSNLNPYILVIFVVYGEWVNPAIVSAVYLVLCTSLLYRQQYIFSLSFDKCTFWIKVSPKCKCQSKSEHQLERHLKGHRRL